MAYLGPLTSDAHAFSSLRMRRRRKDPPGLFGWGYATTAYYNLTFKIGNGTWTAPRVIGEAAEGTYQRVFTGPSSYGGFYILNDGTLWGWGKNDWCQLGLGYASNVSSPTKVTTATNWSKIVQNDNTTLGLRSDGTLWAWGQAYFPTSGTGKQSVFAFTHQQVGAWNWTDVHTSRVMMFGLRSDNQSYIWGSQVVPAASLVYPTGLGTANRGLIATGAYHYIGLTSGGDAYFTGLCAGIGSTTSTTQIGNGSTWIYAAGGVDTTFLVKNDNTLWAIGSAYEGGLGNGASTGTVSSFIQIAGTGWARIYARKSHAYPMNFGIKTDGTLWGWGTNDSNQLGLGDSVKRSTPCQVGAETSWSKVFPGITSTYALKTDNTLWTFSTASSTPVQFGASTWSHICSGKYFTFGVRANGTLWAWGINKMSVFGSPHTNNTNYTSPVQIGTDTIWTKVEICEEDIASKNSGTIQDCEATIIGKKSDGTAWTWGYSGSNCLGVDFTSYYSTPVQVGSATNWKDISLGAFWSTAVKTDGTLWAWGCFADGALGHGAVAMYSTPVQIGSATNWSSVLNMAYTGNPIGVHYFSQALTTTGDRYWWGNNFSNNYAAGTAGGSTSTPVVALGSGWSRIYGSDRATYGIKTDGTLWSWGRSAWGMTGQTDGDTSSPVQIGTNTNWSMVAPGKQNVAALTTDGKMYRWGSLDTGYTSTPVLLSSDPWADVTVGMDYYVAIHKKAT